MNLLQHETADGFSPARQIPPASLLASQEPLEYRRTAHSHNPVDDARGNAEALAKLKELGLRYKDVGSGLMIKMQKIDEARLHLLVNT